ncbi:MAG: pyridoxal phosphate-dependent aminotransferase, partial [Alphaproteobacteria bacterium]
IDLILTTSTNDLPSILVMTYPGNPTGLTYTEEELKKLVAVLRKHKVIVLADEIYGYMTHDGRVLSMASYYPEGTIVSSGLSKWAGVGGWRLGVMMVPDSLITDLKPVLLGLGSEIYSCAPTPIQYAAVTAYDDGEDMRQYRRQIQHLLAAVGNHCQRQLASAGINVHPPAGGFYLFVDFEPHRAVLAKRGIKTGSQLCNALLGEVGIAMLPASAFGMDDSALAARLCYVNFDGEAMLKAVGQGAAVNDLLVQQYAPDTVEGIAKMVEWVLA